MKTKLSKRILSVFLAVLMMVTSVPMAAVTAFADNSGTVITDAYIEAAKKQMHRRRCKHQELPDSLHMHYMHQ